MKIIRKTSAKETVELLKEMAIAKTKESNFANCDLCLVSDG